MIKAPLIAWAVLAAASLEVAAFGLRAAIYHQRVSDLRGTGNGAELVMLGDSLTAQGDWNALLHRPAANFGVNTDTTSGVLKRMHAVPRTARVVFLMIGTNDLGNGVPVARIAANTRSIVEGLPGTVVVQSVPPRNDRPLNPQIAELNALNARFCAVQGCRFLEVATSISPYMAKSADGLHLTAEAYNAWGGRIQSELTSILPPSTDADAARE